MTDERTSIILETSLQSFFYDELQSVNRKSSSPLPNETIFYSSLVMDKFIHAKEYFEVVEGKVREKTLGLKLLETHHLESRKRKVALQDIGDTALMLCGYFSDSVNEKIVDVKYYHDVGMSAYGQLNSLVTSFYDVQYFYKKLATQFNMLTRLIQIVQSTQSSNSSQDKQDAIYIINNAS